MEVGNQPGSLSLEAGIFLKSKRVKNLKIGDA